MKTFMPYFVLPVYNKSHMFWSDFHDEFLNRAKINFHFLVDLIWNLGSRITEWTVECDRIRLSSTEYNINIHER